MTDELSLDGRTLVAVATDPQGEVDAATRFHFEQDGDVIRARYAGGAVREGYLVGTPRDRRWDIRYVQLDAAGNTATGHSVGQLEQLPDGRIRVEDEWEWESPDGSGETVLEEPIP